MSSTRSRRTVAAAPARYTDGFSDDSSASASEMSDSSDTDYVASPAPAAGRRRGRRQINDSDSEAAHTASDSDSDFVVDDDEPEAPRRPAKKTKAVDGAAKAAAPARPRGRPPGAAAAARKAAGEQTAEQATAPVSPAAGTSAPKARAAPRGRRAGEDEPAPLDSHAPIPTPTDLDDYMEEEILPEDLDGDDASTRYQKMSHLDHVLHRPDSYIGSVLTVQQPMWVAGDDLRLENRIVSFVPGLYKIFDEILVNAADNKVRDPRMDKLQVNIDAKEGLITVYNNGAGVPVEIHKTEQVYIPEMVFGHLLTGSNFDDNEKKTTGGRNGYGAKLANIFSREFIIETCDRERQLMYTQRFTHNMRTKHEPVIRKSPTKTSEYTKVTFRPDLRRFGMTHFDEDTVALLRKRVIDMAGILRGVKVYLDSTRIHIKSFKDYVDMYLNPKPVEDPATAGAATDAIEVKGPFDAPPPVFHEIINDRWEICVAPSPDGQFHQVTFVNAICTYKGGTHVNYIAEQVTEAINQVVSRKNKEKAIRPFQIRAHLWVFVNCLIENPTFDSQTKENMTTRASQFGSTAPISARMLGRITKSVIVDNVLDQHLRRQTTALRKTDGSKSSRLVGIPKLDDANQAGTRNSHKCTLILTEGDSAKALAVSGLVVVGRDYYGVFPLRGKLLNVREASMKQVMDNEEITQLKKIIGLQQGRDYTSVDSLRYGHIMIMTDQDHDGSHIKGLIINFLDHFFPSLLRIPGFLLEFITPILKATRGRESKMFFTIPEYERWRAEVGNARGWTIKYYKGLGTSSASEAKEYFSALDLHRKRFMPCEAEERNLIDMAFNKRRADERKDWLARCEEGTFLDHSASDISITDFVNKELVLFSLADNVRSIPSIVDGLKPGHRKILFCCFKRNLRREVKVAQLVGYVSEHSAYLHGEASLSMTIIGMAQDYVGSNNVNLLEPRGMFGTRLNGGKDAASPRYIFTVLAPAARLIFHEADDALLHYLEDDGTRIEPRWYVPVLPMVLVNGSEGIGTGWSSSVPNFNPLDIIDNLERMMRREDPVEMHPWYRGFSGTIEKFQPDRYRVSGRVTRLDATTVEISELPVGTWTTPYKEMLEGLMQDTLTEKETASGATRKSGSPALVKEIREHHSNTTVLFHVVLTEAGAALSDEEFSKRFKLTSTISLSNMVLFDAQGRLRRYDSPLAILEEFYHLRLQYYVLRKEDLLRHLMHEQSVLSNKARFIKMVISGELRLANRPILDIIAELYRLKFDPMPRGVGTAGAKSRIPDAAADGAAASSGITVAGVDGPEEETQEEIDARNASQALGTNPNLTFDYLLNMSMRSMTKERAEELIRQREQKTLEVDSLAARDPTDLWRDDLTALRAEILRLEAAREAEHVDLLERQRLALVSGNAATSKAPARRGRPAAAATGAPRRRVKKED
ncbi:DNA topoisomerase II, partial [Fonticula alba]